MHRADNNQMMAPRSSLLSPSWPASLPCPTSSSQRSTLVATQTCRLRRVTCPTCSRALVPS